MVHLDHTRTCSTGLSTSDASGSQSGSPSSLVACKGLRSSPSQLSSRLLQGSSRTSSDFDSNVQVWSPSESSLGELRIILFGKFTPLPVP